MWGRGKVSGQEGKQWGKDEGRTHESDSGGDLHGLELLVEGDEEPRVHRRHEEVDHPVRLVEDDYIDQTKKMIVS